METPTSLSSTPTILREKPQRGAAGVPFMKRTILDWVMSARRRDSFGRKRTSRGSEDSRDT